MKILIISDIHGNYKFLSKIIDNNTFDKLFILGDILRGPAIDGYDRDKVISILDKYRDKTIVVRGNCDLDEDFLELNYDSNYIAGEEVDGLNFVLTHGHLFNYSNLPDVDFDIFMQGHTHIPVLSEIDGKVFLNPGSITLPKGEFDNSFAVYEDKKITIYEINGKIIMELMINK